MNFEPPYCQLPDFLAEDQRCALLDYVLANAGKFEPATVRSGNSSIINADRRVASVCRDLGPLSASLRQCFLQALPTLIDATGLKGAPPEQLEIEIAAHGDGAFFQAHTDMPVGETRKNRSDETDRVLSAVYYFYHEPKAFSGGELRLFKLGQEKTFTELQPSQNSLLAFHSWVAHEVRPVSCPSGDFRDYRFAINCWYRRRL